MHAQACLISEARYVTRHSAKRHNAIPFVTAT